MVYPTDVIVPHATVPAPMDVNDLPSARVHAACTVRVTSPVVAVCRLPLRFNAAPETSARLPEVASHLFVRVMAMLPVDVSVAAPDVASLAEMVNTPLAVSALALPARDKAPFALKVRSFVVPVVVMSSLIAMVDPELVTDRAPVADHAPVVCMAPAAVIV